MSMSFSSLKAGALTMATLAVLSLAGCGFERVPVLIKKPASKVDLAKAGVKTVAVTSDASLTGADGNAAANALADAMAAQLSQKGFEILDRNSLASLQREQQLGQSGLVDSNTTAEIGKFTGAKAQIVVHLASYGMGRPSVGSQKMQRQVQGQNGQYYTENFTLYTATYPVTIDATFKVLDVATAKVIAMDKAVINDSISVSAEGGQPGDPDPSASLAKCQERVVEKFINAVTSYTVEEVMLFPEGSDIPGMSTGVKHARLGEWDNAAEAFKSAVAAAEADPKASPSDKAATHYGYGMALQMTGDFNAGERELKAAYMLDDKPEYKAAYARCQRARADDAKMKAGR